MTETQAMSETSVFEHSFVVRAARQRVWRALTDPDALTIWFDGHAEVEPRVGGA